MEIRNDANAFDLINGCIIPSMEIFAKNNIVQRILPNFSTKRIEFECFLLSSIMMILLSRKSNLMWFEKNNMVFEMIQATLPFYESTGLNNINNPRLNEDQITKYIFERWGKYEKKLVDSFAENNFSALYELVHEFKATGAGSAALIELNKMRFKVSMLECFTLMSHFGENSKS